MRATSRHGASPGGTGNGSGRSERVSRSTKGRHPPAPWRRTMTGAGQRCTSQGISTTRGMYRRRNIAKWDGQRWSALGSGIESSVGSLFSFRDRDGPGLYALGGFLHAGGRVSAYVARWGPLTNAGT